MSMSSGGSFDSHSPTSQCIYNLVLCDGYVAINLILWPHQLKQGESHFKSWCYDIRVDFCLKPLSLIVILFSLHQEILPAK